MCSEGAGAKPRIVPQEKQPLNVVMGEEGGGFKRCGKDDRVPTFSD